MRLTSSSYTEILNDKNNKVGSFLVNHVSFSFGPRKNCHLLSVLSSTIKDGVEELLTLAGKIPLPFTKDFYDLVVLGPCGGLFCLYDRSSLNNLTPLWNPATGEVKPLPPSTVKHPPEVSIDQVDLYSLKDDSWRATSPLEDVVLNNAKQWSSLLTGGEFGCPLTFDFANEVFERLPLPDFDESRYDCVISSFNGLPAAIIYNNGYSSFEGFTGSVYDDHYWKNANTQFDVWVMTEYGVKEYWVKLHSVGPFSGVEWPLGLSNNGWLFLANPTGQLLFCDASTK
ncbi:uncharacterized protein LOC120000618 [Tripterygium wilfordii]|uniref:uncharacterized protein LOC120000618 n=1 Tax=Tripterygium wilfordii TaxID=458696 RepID=UPI0018F7FD58|nr:uncharacterized protein LOC120000618 [Tripterygium wilfordii]